MENIYSEEEIVTVKKMQLSWKWWMSVMKCKKSESNALSLSLEVKLKTKVFLIFLNLVKEISNKIWSIK